MSTPEFHYRAFLSYSHQDRGWANWLHKALETYRVPGRLVGTRTAAGTIPRRLAPIFRDRDELASATDLSRKVNEALAQSANLIVICSPRSAASHWTNKEVLAYKRLGRGDRIFCLIVDGEPHASEDPGRAAQECFAPALRYHLGPDGALGRERTEPIAADARPGKDGRANAKLKLIAGLLDVGFDDLRQRELHRRHRRMTAIAAVAVAITLITGALAVEALLARRAAERHQKQAEDLIGFMLGDLNGKLGQMQRLDVMEAIDDQAMRYFKSLPSADVTDETLAQRARGLEKIGSIRTDQGHLQAAMESYQTALQLNAALARAAPANPQRQLSYANDWAWIGKTYWSLGRLEAASAAFEAAQRVLSRAELHDPSDTETRYEIATLDNDIGHVLEAQGRLEEAAVHYQNMLRVSRSLVTGTSLHKDWETELGMAHNNLGKLALMSGDLATAIAEYRADDVIETQLSARDPHDNEQLENVVTAHAILGRTLALAGDIPAGIADLRQSMQLAAQLASFDPEHTLYQEDLALYEWQLGRLERLSGDLRDARELTQRSVVIFSTLTSREPGNSAWHRELAEALSEDSAEALAAGEARHAEAQALAALRLLEPLLARQPEERALVLATARARLQRAAAAADPATAQGERRQALEIIASVRSGRADPRLLALETEALLGLGRAADVEAPLGQLAQCGYRDPALMALLERQHIPYTPQSALSADAAVR
ncbi:MAG: toll/interleukin-1 receptor domain-containing protein [Gammaproteobacteria bacterium]|nr:toll/interleukin-1 receptor domain-containing protein [Gammaproteobacteria bacterium]